jgi:ubiquinone/menaquinone biosynthesis C-methylase UbiE
MAAELSPAARAFDSIAPIFDSRFSAWRSVDAQRAAVRRALVAAFPAGGSILEVGGGTGEDAAWLARQGFDVTLTDSSPQMVEIARAKLARWESRAEVAAAEDLERFAEQRFASGKPGFDGVFSNFAPLNCVEDLRPVARGLARVTKTSAPALLVLFGTASPGEVVVETLRGRPHQALRRMSRRPVPARLGGETFTVTYHRAPQLCAAMQPWFRFVKKIGIGVFVPPSAAEPWISRHPRFLSTLEWLDRRTAGALAYFGDHILYQFERTDAPSP